MDEGLIEMRKRTIPVMIIVLIVLLCIVLSILAGTVLAEKAQKQPDVQAFHLSDYEEKIHSYPWDTNIGTIDSSNTAALKAEVLWAVAYGETANPGKKTQVFFDLEEKCWLVKGSCSADIPEGMTISHLIPFMLVEEDGDVLAVWYDYELAYPLKTDGDEILEEGEYTIFDKAYGPDFSGIIPESVVFLGGFQVADYEQQMENGFKVFKQTAPIEDFYMAAEAAQTVWNETEPGMGTGWVGSWENPGNQVEVYYDKDNAYWLVKGTVPYETRFTHEMVFPPCALIRPDGMVVAIWRDPEQ